MCQQRLQPKFYFFGFLFLFTFFSISIIAQVQTGNIKGQVSTNDGKAAAYVNVLVKELNRGTISDEEGNYLLKNVKAGEYTIVTSFVGLQTQEKTVSVVPGQTSQVDIILSENARQLAEVVITDSKSVNEKIVSIGKSNIRPMDLPQSITIIGREVMDQQQVLRLSDVLRNTNGLYVMGTIGGTHKELAGRGFAYSSNNTFKNGVRFNNGVMPETSSAAKLFPV